MQGVPSLDRASTAADFNSIEHIWTHLTRRIQRRHTSERVTVVTDMNLVLFEVWEKITVTEINCEIDIFSIIVSRCLAVNGGYNFHS